ncbi:hypothetical protein BD309DRAFT_57580 [Dichomitus squalens]|nr:hypothetical protein BD309DRAFT_57580 [Dichomitus squalens]
MSINPRLDVIWHLMFRDWPGNNLLPPVKIPLLILVQAFCPQKHSVPVCDAPTELVAVPSAVSMTVQIDMNEPCTGEFPFSERRLQCIECIIVPLDILDLLVHMTSLVAEIMKHRSVMRSGWTCLDACYRAPDWWHIAQAFSSACEGARKLLVAPVPSHPERHLSQLTLFAGRAVRKASCKSNWPCLDTGRKS